MGRNAQPNWFKKKYSNKPKSISLPQNMWDRIDKAKMIDESRSHFIEKILRPIIFNEEEATKLEIKTTQAYLIELQHRLDTINIKREMREITREI